MTQIHRNISKEMILDCTSKVLSQGDQLKERLDFLKGSVMNQEQQATLATAVMSERISGLLNAQYNVSHVLRPRRYNDNGQDAWSVLNRVQESAIRGGVRVKYNKEEKTDNGVILLDKYTTTREIKSLSESNKLNDLVINKTLELVA